MKQGAPVPERARASGYELVMLVLCVLALLALAVERSAPLTEDARALFQYADFAVCLLFLGDFVYKLATAADRWRYFRTWGWIDLLSSVPAVDVLRIGRAARVLRILRVLRGVKATALFVSFLLERRAQSAVLSASLLSTLLVIAAGASVLHFEDQPAANIRTAEDAVWWALATLSTVGYGDRFPVTSEGRVVGVVLMIAGVVLVGTLSGLAASWFLAPVARRDRSDIEELQAQMLELRRSVDRLASDLGTARL
jgi:voltage-gated potassium channel